MNDFQHELARRDLDRAEARAADIRRFTPLADYDVPTSKIFEALAFMHYTTAVAKTFRWTYGDTGVADGTAAPTNEVELGFGGIQVSSASTIFSGGATNPLIPIHFKVPAGKFPCQACSVDVGGATNILYGVEYDA